MQFNFDCHVHTNRSFCGRAEMTPQTLVKLMEQKGLKGFAITDHSSHFYSFSTGEVWDSKSPQFFLRTPHVIERHHPGAEEAIREHISSIRRYAQNGVLVGLEADCDFEGNLMIPPGIEKELDILIGSVHWLPCTVEEDKSSKRCIREFLDIALKLLEKGIYVLAHPTRIFTWSGMEVPMEVVDPLVDAAIAHGVALELNSLQGPRWVFHPKVLGERGEDSHWY